MEFFLYLGGALLIALGVLVWYFRADLIKLWQGGPKDVQEITMAMRAQLLRLDLESAANHLKILQADNDKANADRTGMVDQLKKIIPVILILLFAVQTTLAWHIPPVPVPMPPVPIPAPVPIPVPAPVPVPVPAPSPTPPAAPPAGPGGGAAITGGGVYVAVGLGVIAVACIWCVANEPKRNKRKDTWVDTRHDVNPVYSPYPYDGCIWPAKKHRHHKPIKVRG